MTKTDGYNGMVNIIWSTFADIRVIDSTLVVFETINDLIGNRDWAVFENGMEELGLVTGSDINGSTYNGDSCISGLEVAGRSSKGSVWVSVFSGKTAS
jgi:hypothetical protein